MKVDDLFYMTFENMSSRNLVIIFGVIAAGAAIFIATFVFPAKNLIRETVTEEVMIVNSSNGKCVVNTNDAILSAKTIDNCNLPQGTKVKVSYQKGLPDARVVSP